MFDGIINNLPMELHLPTFQGEYVPGGSFNNKKAYSFAGPGTKFEERIKEGYKGINDLDKAAKEHDTAYYLFKDRDKRNISDRILAEKALKISQDHSKDGLQRGWAALVYKTFCEGGIASKMQGKGYTLRERKDINYSESKSKAKSKAVEKEDNNLPLFETLANELHKPARKNFPRRKVFVHNIDETWGMDLVFMTDLSKQNNGFKYLLTVIDLFSKYAWAIPIKDKEAKTVFNAFIKVINESGRKPNNLWVDEGSEFYNSTFKKWLKENKVNIYSTYENFHNPIIERFNRTLKTEMWKRFTKENTRNYINFIDELVNQYNNKKHRSIRMAPKEASDIKNRDEVHANLYPEPELIPAKPKFRVGDIVRISRLKGTFEKGFHPSWSEELLKIEKINNTNPRTYKIVALDGEEVTGSFYEQELQKSKQMDENLYRVEKILKKKKVNGKEMVLVKWSGYDHPSWTNASDIIDSA